MIKYIIEGVQKVFIDTEKPKTLYMTDLIVENEDDILKKKAQSSGVSKLRYYWRQFATFNFRPPKLPINTTNEGAVVEGLVLGHPDVMKKINLNMKEVEL